MLSYACQAFFLDFFGFVFFLSLAVMSPISGGYGAGVPPLPIPNRAVKPGRADGTASQWESR